MKIGISTSVVQKGKTGVAQYVFALLRALLPYAKTHTFFVFVLEEDLPLFEFARGAMQLVTVKETERPAVRNILWHQTRLPGLARRLGLEVLHVPSYRRMLWRRPCPLVATIHDLAPFRVQRKYDWKRMLYGRVVVKRLARRQDAIIAPSQCTADDIERFFQVPPERVSVIWNGIDHSRFSPGDPGQAKAAAGRRWTLDRPFFLYVSRLEHPAKNHVRLIQAFETFRARTGSDWLLALGGSDWHGAEAIHATAQASRFGTDIRFLGFVDDASLPELYRAAEGFVYPSLFEGFGLPPVEAMACGCPVTSSDRGSLREVVGDAALILDPDDLQSMAEALTQLATRPDRRQQLRAAGLVNAQRFRWDRCAEATLDVLTGAGQAGTPS